MILEAIREMGAFTWLLVGFVLMALEVLVPGVFLIWFGLAAVVVGGFAIAPFTAVAGFGFSGQLLLFAILSVVFAFVGRRLVRDEDKSHLTRTEGLNDRMSGLHGRTVVLIDAIVNGHGRARLGDSLWRVTGPDASEGTTVRIVGHEGETLKVEPV